MSKIKALQKERKQQLQSFGIAFNLEGDAPEIGNAAALKREKAAKALFEFQLPLRCCWLFPKVRMPGMRSGDDAYGKLDKKTFCPWLARFRKTRPYTREHQSRVGRGSMASGQGQ